MNVYVEFVIIDNFVFDYLLLLLTFYKDRKQINKRIIISSLFGTVFALVFPLLNLHELILFALKILLAFSMVAIAGKFITFKEYILQVNKFILLTFLFGGIIYGVYSLFGLEYSFLYGTTNSFLPLGLMILTAIILYFSGVKLFCRFFEKKLIYPFVCKCKLYKNGQEITVNGFIDSGNSLLYNGCESVCIASGELVKKIYLSSFLEGESCGIITANTIAGSCKIKVYEIDLMKIYSVNKKNIIYKVKLGIPQRYMTFSDDYQLILPADYALYKG